VTAARDAFLTKRVGDVLLLMSVVALSAWAGSLEFNDLYAWSAGATLPALGSTLLGLGLIAGPMGKCAQFPMHLWLDEAMEGPNPASILRNSVVVTCGAVVLLKLMPLLRLSPLAIDVLLVVGTISAVGGALVSIAQVDLKRACSYSTTSYLGLVFIAIALQQPFIALLLLFAHAVAKAVLFMSVGSVITTTNCQDLTELGGLAPRMPATTTAFLAGAAGMTGVLPLGCFWSFGLMVEGLIPVAPLFAVVVLLTNTLTAVNLTRVYRQVFLGSPQPKTRRTPEVNWLMALPMVSVSVLVLLTPLVMARIDRVPGIAAFSSGTALVLIGSGLAGLVTGSLIPLDAFRSRSLLKPLRIFQDLLALDFYTDRIYRGTIVAFVAGMARLTNGFDQVVVNGLVNRIADASMASAQSLRLGVSGRLQTYVFTVVVAIVLLVGSLAWLGG
jgi:NAD(P)H-quinone oxidoreductase subunit 5